MPDEMLKPFDSIESALEYMVLLESVISEVSNELQDRAGRAATERYKNGLQLALFKTNQLAFHVQKSRRILNDLRLIRGVLVGDGIALAEAENGIVPQTY
jgi:hypothetical protein